MLRHLKEMRMPPVVPLKKKNESVCWNPHRADAMEFKEFIFKKNPADYGGIKKFIEFLRLVEHGYLEL